MFGIHVLMAPGFVTSIAHDCPTTSQTLVIGLFVFALCDFVQLAKVGLCAASHKQHITTSKGRAHCHRSLFHVAFAIYALSFAMRRCVFGAQVALFLVWRRASPLHKRQETRLSSVSIGIAYEI